MTFRNVLYVRVGKLIVRLWRRSVRERSFEEASGETEVGRRLLAPEPRPLQPACKPNHTLNQRPLQALFCLKLDNTVVMLATVVATTATLLSNSRKSASFFDTFYFRSTETVRPE